MCAHDVARCQCQGCSWQWKYFKSRRDWFLELVHSVQLWYESPPPTLGICGWHENKNSNRTLIVESWWVIVFIVNTRDNEMDESQTSAITVMPLLTSNTALRRKTILKPFWVGHVTMMSLVMTLHLNSRPVMMSPLFQGTSNVKVDHPKAVFLTCYCVSIWLRISHLCM